MIQHTISLKMPVPSQSHCGFPSFPVVDLVCLFVDLRVLPFPLKDCSVFGNFVFTLICLMISYLRIKSYNVLNYNICSTDWSFPLIYIT
jgi:hypothetical protein